MENLLMTCQTAANRLMCLQCHQALKGWKETDALKADSWLATRPISRIAKLELQRADNAREQLQHIRRQLPNSDLQRACSSSNMHHVEPYWHAACNAAFDGKSKVVIAKCSRVIEKANKIRCEYSHQIPAAPRSVTGPAISF